MYTSLHTKNNESENDTKEKKKKGIALARPNGEELNIVERVIHEVRRTLKNHV